ncbi:MAG TPA: 2-iminoacetate synthase ThiH, partial [Candidatus Bathyarchaeia archaeon]|nr:2-iminoacetate synthase ThiH [Candidatus Bathyarchaeia archaeon]
MLTFSLETIKKILKDTSPETTESLARQAASLTRQYFGRAIPLYAPLYISNYCSSQCTYCGFNNHHNIIRKKLSPAEIRQEAQTIA